MKHIHLDAVGGIAGDMFVAALLDAFPDVVERVLGDAMAVVPPQAGMAVLTPGSSSSIACLRFGLRQPARAGLSLVKPPSVHGARYRDMVARIEAAELATGTAAHAIGILTILAEAEARIHGVAVDDVHFHEVGDWDSLLDVVAAGSIIAAVAPATWSVSPLPRGGGLVRTQHGLLPVPAPATAAILQQFTFRDDGISGERVTPTGAAILRYLDAASDAGQGRLLASGTGAGTRDLPGMPNVLRALVFEPTEQARGDRVTLISFEIDDMTGEEIGTAAELLRAESGVLDVSLSQRQGKKHRPMHAFHILVKPERADEVIERCFQETSTIGLRRHEEARVVLRRQAATSGAVRTKTVARPGSSTVKAENDDLSGNSLAERRAAKQRAEGAGP